MKKYIYAVGTVALSLVISGLPVVALAERSGSEGQGSVNISARVTGQVLGENASTSVSARAGEGGRSSGEQEHQSEVSGRGEQASSTDTQIVGGGDGEIDLELGDGGTPAISGEDLKQKIEVRKNQLAQLVASSSPDHQAAIANANEVRLAVHALLVSQNLVGGVGQQVSQIATEVDHSVASTTNAEAQIQSRGFLVKLLFGGDTAAAQVIDQQVAQNQKRIDDLNKLLAQANVSADIQVTLKAQIAAMQNAQTRLLDLAQKEQSMWGLFSWRF